MCHESFNVSPSNNKCAFFTAAYKSGSRTEFCNRVLDCGVKVIAANTSPFIWKGVQVLALMTQEKTIYLFYLFVLNSAFNTFYRSYHKGRFIGRWNQCRVVRQEWCNVNYRPSVSLLSTFPDAGHSPGSKPTTAEVGGKWHTTAPLRPLPPWKTPC